AAERQPRRQRDRCLSLPGQHRERRGRVPLDRLKPSRRLNQEMADPRPRANDAWEAMLSAHASLMRRFSAEEVWEDISMKEYDVLYTLSKCPEPIRPTDLNQHVLLSQPALSRLVDRLAARGLVQRIADRRDLRTVRLALTEDGRAPQRRRGPPHPPAGGGALRARAPPDGPS